MCLVFGVFAIILYKWIQSWDGRKPYTNAAPFSYFNNCYDIRKCMEMDYFMADSI